MFTLNLSRFLSGPPGPELQKLNALLHQEPYSTIAYCIYWSLLLLLGAPLVGIGLLWILLYELIRHFVWKRRRIEPKKTMNNDTDNDNLSNRQDQDQLAVVVTGCDTGFGKELVFRLAAEGFVVFAGCLKEESAKNHFTLEPLIRPVIVDVTNDKQIQECYKTVQTWLDGAELGKLRHFHSLVNNAGAGRLGYIDWTKLSDYEFCMNLNCYSQIRMCKAFLPIFKQQAIARSYNDSQIVNMISMAGMVSAGGIGATPYEVSKNAAEAFTNALRLEMKMFGVKVVSVNPSFHNTPLGSNVRERLRKEAWSSLSPELQKEYGAEFFETFVDHVERMTTATEWDFKVVVDSMMEAIQSSHPPAQLLIGSDARFTVVVLRMLPQWARHYIVQLSMPRQTPAMLSTNAEAL